MLLTIRQLFTLARNGYLEILRQPVFLILLLASVAVVGTMPMLSLFAFGEEQRLVNDSALALMFLTGVIAAGYHASSTLSGEIRRGTALVVLAKPVGRLTFLLGKFAGLTAALGVLFLGNLFGGWLAGRATLGSFQIDLPVIGALYLGILVALALAGGSNFLFRRPFCSDAALLVPALLLVMVILVRVAHPAPRGEAVVDPLLVRAYVLIFPGLAALAALALAVSTRFDVTPTMAICTVALLVGLMADYWFGRRSGSSWLAAAGYAVVPNWQQFWAADALGGGGRLPWSYIARAAGYAGVYSAAMLAAAAALFRSRELG